MKLILETIVNSIDLTNKTYVDSKDRSVKQILPERAYLVPLQSGEHERYVTDEKGVISKQSNGIFKLNPSNVTSDSTYTKQLVANSQGDIGFIDRPNFIDTTIYKTITANTIIDDTFHNAIVLVKSSATITLPANLRADLNFVVRTFTGVTATFVIGSGATNSAESTGTTLDEKSMGSIMKDGTDNYLITI